MLIEKSELRIKITPSLRNFIVEERENKGFTATKLANEMKRPQSWIAQIENGRTKTIKNIDFITIFTTILNVSPEEADKYLEENQAKYQIENNSSSFADNVSSDSLNVFKIDTSKQDLDKLKDEYKKVIDNIYEGFEFFFEKVDNKQDAINMLKSFKRNLHTEMGFTLSITSLPICRLKKTEPKSKKIIFEEIFKLIETYGSDCKGKKCDCEDDKDNDKTEK